MTVGELFDGLFQCGVFLANDFVEVRRLHPGFLKLLEWPPGLHSLVLASVAREDYAVLLFQPAQEFVNLARAREARFIHDVQVPIPVVMGRLGKVALQGGRLNAGVFKLMGGAGGRRKPSDLVALARGSLADCG
jgi:hypothetical protein